MKTYNGFIDDAVDARLVARICEKAAAAFAAIAIAAAIGLAAFLMGENARSCDAPRGAEWRNHDRETKKDQARLLYQAPPP